MEDLRRGIDKAEIYLTNSWALGTLSANRSANDAAGTGSGEGRERLELWFQRAMDLDPATTRPAPTNLVPDAPVVRRSQQNAEVWPELSGTIPVGMDGSRSP